MFLKGSERMDLSEDRENWCAVTNTVWKFDVILTVHRR